MKIKYIGRGSYYHHPYLFDRNKHTHEVEEDIGAALVKHQKLFEIVLGPKEDVEEKEELKEPDTEEGIQETKEPEDVEVEEIEKGEKPKQEPKKKAAKKDK